MITPTEIRQKASNKYNSYLQSVVEGIPFIPIPIAGNKRPDSDPVKFEAELTELISHSKDKKGYGYVIEYHTIKTKLMGTQGLPDSIVFQTESDFLKFIGKEKETAKFKQDIVSILSAFPKLKDWVLKYPQKVIDNDWDSILKVCTYFKNTPQPNLYIRELPIQVHTKFIERNKGIIKELLDILIADYIDHDAKNFESRFHLKYDEPIVRFRILDQSISHQFFSDVEDIGIPISQFKKLLIPIRNVYVVENKTNMLSFPAFENSIVICGMGFRVDILKEAKWLNEKKMFYWGDFDAQGFQILSETRTHFPNIKSFLMDRETFDKFYEGDKGKETNVEKELCLTLEENDMFQYLKINNLRLEQEKIPYEYALERIPR